MKKRLLLLHVPYGELYGGKVNLRKAGLGLPPIGVASLSAYVREKTACHVKVIDMLFHGVSIADLSTVLSDFKPDIVGLSATTPQMDNAYAVARAVKGHQPRIQTVIGGAHVTALPQRTLQEETCVDFGILGEGEIPLQSLIEEKPLDSIKSLVWRKGDDAIVVNERQPLIQDLSTLPFPDYAALPLDRYKTIYSGSAIGIMSSRGCKYNCSFCASHVISQGCHRLRPIGMVLDDIERLLKLGVHGFAIFDDTFTASNERVYEFLDGYGRRNLKEPWSCETRVDCLDRKIIRAMHRSGLNILKIGVESGNQKILDKVGKGIKLAQVRQVCEWCADEGITVYAYFILGLPYETKETMLETIEFARNLPIDFAQFSMLMPLPGTRVWKMAEEGKVLRNLAKSWSDYDRYKKAIVELNGVSTDEITKMHRQAARSFYLRFSYIFKILRKIRNWNDLITYFRLGWTFLRA
jgi:radical SAM superfamily enzyme YgiQ (UPF0313 family)